MNGSLPKTALVTGCSTGIGRATALLLQQAGYTTWATARDASTLAELERTGCRTAAVDVTDEASMQAAVDATGGVDVLVNNAGYAEYGPAELIPMDRWRKQFETNVFGLVRLSQLVLPHMRERGWGRIVNLSSMGGEIAFPLGAAYHGTKFAVEAISDVMRVEVAPFGVRVVLIQPGPIKSEFEATADATLSEYATGPYAAIVQAFARLMAGTYDSRLTAGPDKVAKAIVKAVSADRAPTRVKVTPHAHVLIRARRFLPDRAWDAAMSRRLPT